jgi:hypothetical protein
MNEMTKCFSADAGRATVQVTVQIHHENQAAIAFLFDFIAILFHFVFSDLAKTLVADCASFCADDLIGT